MPLPQVNDRLKEIPAQALRTLFATIGQLLLVADRLRARAAEQLSGNGEATHSAPAPQAPSTAPPATPVKPAAPRTAPAPDAESARWRSLDKTGNVRVLAGDEEQDEEDLAVPAASAVPEPSAAEPSAAEPSVSEPIATEAFVPEAFVPEASVPRASVPEPVIQEAPEAAPAPAEYTPTEPVPVRAPADLAPAEPAPADLAPAEPAPADLAPAEPAATPATGSETLPVPNYDQLSVASLRARLRVLDADQVQVLLDYEKAHEGRPAVTTMFERRLTKLSEGS
jgi:hypothetical protein